MQEVLWPEIRSMEPNIKVEPDKHFSLKVGSDVGKNVNFKIDEIVGYNIGVKVFTDVMVIKKQDTAGRTPESFLWRRYVTTDNQTLVYTFEFPEI